MVYGGVIYAIGAGILHAFSPDHWLPFVLLAKTMGWSWKKLLRLVLIAGLIHLGLSVLIASLGILASRRLLEVTAWESHRAGIAAFLMMAFGFTFLVWAVKERIRSRWGQRDITPIPSFIPQAVLTIAVLGPCEPLIPLLFWGALQRGTAVIGLSLLFSIGTLAAMAGVTYLGYSGLSLAFTRPEKKISPVFAAVGITLTAVMVFVFGV